MGDSKITGASYDAFFSSIRPLLESVKARFDKRKETLAYAESCTGGLLSAVTASLPGASSFYLGGVVSYHGSVKNKILQVPIPLIRSFGEVSMPVAQAMAKGAREAVGADWAIAITGIAGPTGGTPEKPVGMVCFGLVGPTVDETVTKHFPSEWSRARIQQASAQFALEILLKS